MDDVVPGALQRLRAADIIRMAGLTTASLGQEYCRIGAVQATMRRGAHLLGVVDMSSASTRAALERSVSPSAQAAQNENMSNGTAASPTEGVEAVEQASLKEQRYTVDVEIQSSSAWLASCSCNTANHSICQHVAALLYQWLAHPVTFTPPSSLSSSPYPTRKSVLMRAAPFAQAARKEKEPEPLPGEQKSPLKSAVLTRFDKEAGASSLVQSEQAAYQSGRIGHPAVVRGPLPAVTLIEILTGMALSELRGIAREYDINTTSLNKQQLSDAIASVLKQAEVVRRVAGGLEKPQRQLLATLILAGGSITDDDLQGLFERFSFGEVESVSAVRMRSDKEASIPSPAQSERKATPIAPLPDRSTETRGRSDKLQAILLALQSKGLLFRTSLNSSPQQRIGLSGSVFDVGWYVPAEVRTALHVLVPITPFNRHREVDDEIGTPKIQRVEAYSLLADLLLVARALDGYRLENDDEKDERNTTTRLPHQLSSLRTPGSLANDGTEGIASPSGLPSSALMQTLQAAVPRTSLYLRYALRLLRLADILHKDDAGSPHLRLLPNAARLLLGPTSAEVARDLFELWLTQSGYDELFELQEENLRLRCRTTPFNYPVLRPGELEAENSEARQLLVALIAQAPLDQWISFPAFARFIYRLNPSFLQKRQRLFPSPHWWLEEEEGRPLQPTQMHDWMRAEGHYLARLLRGPLHWWGITDLALSSDGRLLAFRLTPMAGLLLNGIYERELAGDAGEQNYAHPSSVLNVLETGELLITCTPAAWPLIELVEDFAVATGVRNNCLCYRLAPGPLAEALGRGQRPTDLLKLLQQIAEDEAQVGSPLQNLLAQLERWTAGYGRVRLYTDVSLLEVVDTLVLRELQATTSVEEQVIQAISPTLMLLKKQGTERIVEDLKRRGQVPLLHEKEL